MFKELAVLIKARPLTLTAVALDGDKLRVCVIPQSLESDKNVNDKAGHNKEVAKIPEVAIKALTTPLCLEGTAEELDAEMPEKLTKFSEAHNVLRGALSQAQDQIAEAVKAIEDRGKAKAKPKQASGKDSKSTDDKANNGKTEKNDAESRKSDSLLLEWCVPPTATGTNAKPEDSNPATNPQTEEAQ